MKLKKIDWIVFVGIVFMCIFSVLGIFWVTSLSNEDYRHTTSIMEKTFGGTCYYSNSERVWSCFHENGTLLWIRCYQMRGGNYCGIQGSSELRMRSIR